jgi:hypothetical protein
LILDKPWGNHINEVIVIEIVKHGCFVFQLSVFFPRDRQNFFQCINHKTATAESLHHRKSGKLPFILALNTWKSFHLIDLGLIINNWLYFLLFKFFSYQKLYLKKFVRAENHVFCPKLCCPGGIYLNSNWNICHHFHLFQRQFQFFKQPLKITINTSFNEFLTNFEELIR